MNVQPVDWIILAVFFVLLTFGGLICRRYVKGVADFLVGGRKMRKFLGLSTLGAEGLGLISVVVACQEGFARGFSIIWIWLVGLLVTAVVFGGFGFVIMRFRETKAMTLAQYFEDRYSKKVRVVSGFVTALSGLLNMAVFPIVGGLFLIHFMGLPNEMTLFGVTMRSEVPLMTVMIGFALLFTFLGGMVSVGALGAVPPEGSTEEAWQRAAPAIFLGQSFPPIIKGLFLSGLIAAFVSTVDSYFLAWGANITNDVICPYLKKPLSPAAHLKLVRVVILGIAVFLWLFGVMYTPRESVMEYLLLTGSMFHGTGIITIGGLYWKRGTAPAALVAVLTVCAVPFLDLLFRRIFDGYEDVLSPAHVGFANVCLGGFLYVTISLLTPERSSENV